MIRHAKASEIERILDIYASARVYMRETGNPTQWAGNYPDRDTLLDDIEKAQLYVMIKDEYDLVVDSSAICGVFALMEGEDPTYGYIEGGQWISDEPYGTLHRVASDGTTPGFFSKCVAFAREKHDHLRIDTHRDNKPMQKVIDSQGFEYCGIIYLEDGDQRLAYEWIEVK
ncbi:MAG: N-acetyltransferase [Firmicutes bacterium]|nr:N-acetyltransferase [Bacillota bacterium]